MSILDTIAEKAGYPVEVVKRAFENKARDERGEGTFGGLATDEEMVGTPTSPRVAAATAEPEVGAGTVLQAPEEIAAPIATPATEETGGGWGKTFGDLAKGAWNQLRPRFDAGYVTGDRPMTAWDFATDVLSAAGPTLVGKEGIDIHKRNIELREQRRKEEESVAKIASTKAAASEKELKRQKAALDVEKGMGDAVANIMNDFDSDLWSGEIKDMAKRAGITVSPGTVGMVDTMANKLAEAGVSHPAEVLQNPDNYEPELVNRVQFTMKMLSKKFQESQAAELEKKSKTQAMGISRAAEGRAATKYGQEQAALGDVESMLAGVTDPKKQAALRTMIQIGGTSRAAALKDLAGISTGGASTKWKAYLQQAGGDPELALELEQRAVAEGAAMKKVVTTASESKQKLVGTLDTIKFMEDAVKKLKPGKKGAFGRLESYTKSKLKRIVGDEQMSVVDSFQYDMIQSAKNMGIVGVVTEGDAKRIEAALGFKDSDTLDMYLARAKKMKALVTMAINRQNEAIETGKTASTITPGENPFWQKSMEELEEEAKGLSPEEEKKFWKEKLGKE